MRFGGQRRSLSSMSWGRTRILTDGPTRSFALESGDDERSMSCPMSGKIPTVPWIVANKNLNFGLLKPGGRTNNPPLNSLKADGLSCTTQTRG
jgi:hypothetical protein